MKNLMLTALLLFVFQLTIVAQDDAIYNEIADKTCTCITDKEDLNASNMEAFQNEMGMCMLTAIMEMDPTTLDKLNIDMGDQTAMYDFGEKVGGLMALNCPVFMNKIMEMMTEDDSELLEMIKENEGDGSTKDFGTVEGKFVKISGDKFATVIIKDDNGKQQELIWLKYFENSELLIESPQKMKGKRLKIDYTEYESYLPAAKGYYKIKEIKKLEIVE